MFDDNKTVVGTFTQVKISCIVNGYPLLTRYIWYKDNVEVRSSFKSQILLNVISPAYSGRYTCKAINEYGYKISDGKYLVVWSK